MPIVSKKDAEQMLARLSKRAWSRAYCLLRFKNVFTAAYAYVYCSREEQYRECLTSPSVGFVNVLWASARFKAAHPHVAVRKRRSRKGVII